MFEYMDEICINLLWGVYDNGKFFLIKKWKRYLVVKYYGRCDNFMFNIKCFK